MNRRIGMISSICNVCAVTGFALCLLFGFLFGNYVASMFIAFSFVPMICALTVAGGCEKRATENATGGCEKKAAGNTAMVFAGMYAVVILIVYFTQVTTVRLETLNEQAVSLIDYTTFGLFFNLDLLGYCLMAISTFFAGLTIRTKTKSDKALKVLLLVHGIFAISCFIIPMLGVFSDDMQGADFIGTAILLFWCAYFIPVGILSFLYFRKQVDTTMK